MPDEPVVIGEMRAGRLARFLRFCLNPRNWWHEGCPCQERGHHTWNGES